MLLLGASGALTVLRSSTCHLRQMLRHMWNGVLKNKKIKTKRKEPYHILSYLCSFPVLPNHLAEMLLQKEKERDNNPQFLFPSVLPSPSEAKGRECLEKMHVSRREIKTLELLLCCVLLF